MTPGGSSLREAKEWLTRIADGEILTLSSTDPDFAIALIEEKDALEERYTSVRRALSAYRSALSCGERESDELREMGNEALGLRSARAGER